MTWYVIQCLPKEKCKTCVAYSVATGDSTEVKFILLFLMQVLMRTFSQWRPFRNVPMKQKQVLAKLFSQLADILNKFQLLWEKSFGFVTEGAPAVVDEN